MAECDLPAILKAYFEQPTIIQVAKDVEVVDTSVFIDIAMEVLVNVENQDTIKPPHI